jgi:hypothetical protein
MADIVSLHRPPPNEKLISFLKEVLAEAEAGVINGITGIRLRTDNGFCFFRVGDCSDLELAGALAFAQHDLVAGNPRRNE